jgi:opacity protein-like surface antigen
MIPDRSLAITGTAQSQVAKKAQLALCGEFGVTFPQAYYLGLLITGRYSGASNTAQTPIFMNNYFTHTYRINYFIDFLLKPGYKFTPKFMFYGLVGPTIMNWKHTSDHMRNTSLRNTLDINRTSIGLGLGFGFEYMAHSNCALSIDYTQHFFGTSKRNTSITYRNPTLPPGFDIFSGNVTKKVQPSFATVAARITVFFNL